MDYQPPKYDPFTIFQPTQTFIKEKLKELRQQCYALIDEGNQDEWAKIFNQARLEQLNKRIRDYEFRLKQSQEKPGDNNRPNQQTRITQEHIFQAKQHPITDFLDGKFQRRGKTLVGLCPFQAGDRHPSFTIYADSNKFVCFSCGEKGDVIDFVSKTQNLTFHQAIKYILKI